MTSGSQRLVVRVEGDRDAAWAQALPGVTVSEVAAGAARLVLDDGVDSDRVLRAAMAAGGSPSSRSAPPSVRGLPGVAAVTRFVLFGVLFLLLLAFRVWRHRRRAAGTGSPHAARRTTAVSAAHRAGPPGRRP